MFFGLVFTHLARIEDRFSFRGKSSAARILGTRTRCCILAAMFSTANGENVTVCGKKYGQIEMFYSYYP